MTREECIKVLLTLHTFTTLNGYPEETREALDMAVEALQMQEEYVMKMDEVREAYANISRMKSEKNDLF